MPVRVSLRRGYILTCWATIWHTGMKYTVCFVIDLICKLAHNLDNSKLQYLITDLKRLKANNSNVGPSPEQLKMQENQELIRSIMKDL